MQRGQIVWCNYGNLDRGSETTKRRPAVIIQIDRITDSGVNTVVVVPFSRQLNKQRFIGNVLVSKFDSGLEYDSVAEANQVAAISTVFIEDTNTILHPAILNKIVAGVCEVIGAH